MNGDLTSVAGGNSAGTREHRKIDEKAREAGRLSGMQFFCFHLRSYRDFFCPDPET